MSNINTVKLDLLLEHLQTNGHVYLRANGHSMSPMIMKGDMLNLEKKSDGRYYEGEIVAYVKDDTVYIHRMICVQGDSNFILTKGDHLEYSDKLIRKEEIIGRVTGINGKKINYCSPLHALIFRLYRFSMLFLNPHYERLQAMSSISLGPGRFYLTRKIAKGFKQAVSSNVKNMHSQGAKLHPK